MKNQATGRAGALRLLVLTLPLLASFETALSAAAPPRDRTPRQCQQCPACGAEPAPQRVVELKIYNQPHISEARVDQILDVTNRIWQRYGVTVQSSSSTDAIAVVLAGSTGPLATDFRPITLGDTLFTNGHATPYLHLWLGNAEALAGNAEIEGQSFTSLATDARMAILMRMLGVALAHELGHYLLDTTTHSAGGLLRANLAVSELAHPNPEHFRLTAKQQRLMCADVSASR